MHINKLQFRNAKPEDIPSIMEIEHASFSSVICEKQEVFIERINIFPEGFRVMLYEGKPIGYICTEIWKKQRPYSDNMFKLGHSIAKQHSISGDEIYISSMGILPAWRSQGIGKLMFNKYIKYAEKTFVDVNSIILIVSEKWLNARRIYKSEGFKEVHLIRNFFRYGFDKSDFEDGIVMRKKRIKRDIITIQKKEGESE